MTRWQGKRNDLSVGILSQRRRSPEGRKRRKVRHGRRKEKEKSERENEVAISPAASTVMSPREDSDSESKIRYPQAARHHRRLGMASLPANPAELHYPAELHSGLTTSQNKSHFLPNFETSPTYRKNGEIPPGTMIISKEASYTSIYNTTLGW
jgi:hypothetical protein